jgi:hypothetical protein
MPRSTTSCAIHPNPPPQILDSDKYINQVHPVVVQLPGVAARLGDGWRQVGSGVLGELDARVLLEQWGSSHSEAVRVASGWSGDQWQLVEKDGHTAMLFKSTWETLEAADAFFSAYARGLRYRFAFDRDTANAIVETITASAL